MWVRHMKTCYCCSNKLHKRNTELHHFPNPKRLGGKSTIPLCSLCHNLIDRFNLEDWPIDMITSAKESWVNVPESWKLIILKVLSNLNELPVNEESNFIRA
jgi:hypothetical protein